MVTRRDIRRPWQNARDAAGAGGVRKGELPSAAFIRERRESEAGWRAKQRLAEVAAIFRRLLGRRIDVRLLTLLA
jgi:hypothetical protein